MVESNVRMGFEAKLYYCQAGSAKVDGAEPAWQEVVRARDMTPSASFGEADVSTRGNAPTKESEPTLESLSLDVELLLDVEAPDVLALSAAYEGRLPIGIARMTGPIETPGSRGVAFDAKVFKWEEKEPLENGAQLASITLKPCLDSGARRIVVGEEES